MTLTWPNDMIFSQFVLLVCLHKKFKSVVGQRLRHLANDESLLPLSSYSQGRKCRANSLIFTNSGDRRSMDSNNSVGDMRRGGLEVYQSQSFAKDSI